MSTQLVTPPTTGNLTTTEAAAALGVKPRRPPPSLLSYPRDSVSDASVSWSGSVGAWVPFVSKATAGRLGVQLRAGEAPQDHRKVARADDTRTDPPQGGEEPRAGAVRKDRRNRPRSSRTVLVRLVGLSRIATCAPLGDSPRFRFPGAWRTPGGHWRIPASEVQRLRVELGIDGG